MKQAVGGRYIAIPPGGIDSYTSERNVSIDDYDEIH